MMKFVCPRHLLNFEFMNIGCIIFKYVQHGLDSNLGSDYIEAK